MLICSAEYARHMQHVRLRLWLADDYEKSTCYKQLL